MSNRANRFLGVRENQYAVKSRRSPVGANPAPPIGRSAGSNQFGPKSKESHLPVRIVGRSVIPPNSGTAARVPGTHPFDGTVLASRKCSRILGMTRCRGLCAFWPCCEPRQRKGLRDRVEIPSREPTHRPIPALCQNNTMRVVHPIPEHFFRYLGSSRRNVDNSRAFIQDSCNINDLRND